MENIELDNHIPSILSNRSADENIQKEYACSASNGEEIEYRNSRNQLSYIANFSKGLPHNEYGEVESSAYRALLRALASGTMRDFENIPKGSPVGRRLANPMAGLATLNSCTDGEPFFMPPSPRIDSKAGSAEMGELYWMALLRDVHFEDFERNNLVQRCITSLSDEFPDYVKLVHGEQPLAPQNLFRGITDGDRVGPYVSQFLIRGTNSDTTSFEQGIVNFGPLAFSQKQRTPLAHIDYVTDYQTFIDIQNGKPASNDIQFDAIPRFIRTPRDLANYVHYDVSYQAYLIACLILLDMGVPFDHGNPYIDSQTQTGFATLGVAHILSLVAEAASRALKAVWYQKWYVHRRLRPEALGGLVQFTLLSQQEYPVHANLINSSVLQDIYQHNETQHGDGSFFLPLAYPEGSPMHPSYGAGHATIAGACVTVLKAFFDESFEFSEILTVSEDGSALEPYTSDRPQQKPGGEQWQDEVLRSLHATRGNSKLTVGGELDKLAANISIGRNMAGIHYFTDYSQAIRLGEAVAIELLKEQKFMLREEHFYSLRTFDGHGIMI